MKANMQWAQSPCIHNLLSSLTDSGGKSVGFVIPSIFRKVELLGTASTQLLTNHLSVVKEGLETAINPFTIPILFQYPPLRSFAILRSHYISRRAP